MAELGIVLLLAEEVWVELLELQQQQVQELSDQQAPTVHCSMISEKAAVVEPVELVSTEESPAILLLPEDVARIILVTLQCMALETFLITTQVVELQISSLVELVEPRQHL